VSLSFTKTKKTRTIKVSEMTESLRRHYKSRSHGKVTGNMYSVWYSKFDYGSQLLCIELPIEITPLCGLRIHQAKDFFPIRIFSFFVYALY